MQNNDVQAMLSGKGNHPEFPATKVWASRWSDLGGGAFACLHISAKRAISSSESACGMAVWGGPAVGEPRFCAGPVGGLHWIEQWCVVTQT